MTIDFKHVTPAPLAGVISSTTDIWERDCTFERGKKYRIVAPSGKGKSTFMHYIYGLRDDYSGTVKLAGQDTRQIHADAWAELRQDRLSIVYQDLRLFLQLTAVENLEVKTVLYHDNFEEKIRSMATRLQVSHLLGKKAQTLSYGERQRVAIIRALIQPFDWLLLDEPFSHLDKDNSSRAAELIFDAVKERQAGMIITSLGQDNYFSYDHEFQL